MLKWLINSQIIYLPGECGLIARHTLTSAPIIIRMMKLAPHEQKHLLASSILKEGAAWTDDNIGGGYGVIQKLRWEIELHEASLSKIRMKISEEKKQLVLLSNQYI